MIPLRFLPCRHVASFARRSMVTRLKPPKFLFPHDDVPDDAIPIYQPPDFTDDFEYSTPVHSPYPSNPVTSAHCIDVPNAKLSDLDCASITKDGSIIHGRYGKLGDVAQAIPLEYLALLHPAAEGCAALRVTLEKSPHRRGTLLVYGADLANGLAVAQVASGAGHAVVSVISGDRSGDELFVQTSKFLLEEPGTAVPEEYALSKKLFAELVDSIVTGDDGTSKPASPEEYLADFKRNFIDQCAMYPDTRPAAVAKRHMELEVMEKDREFWELNLETYLSQFPQGAPPIDEAKLNAFFTTEQYELFRKKFWRQTSAVISGDDPPFSPPHIVRDMLQSPEELGKVKEAPYAFSILDQEFFPDTNPPAGGPLLGAIICVTPTLLEIANKIAAEKTLRAKAEALQFVPKNQKASFGAACSVAAVARKAGAPITVIGAKLPGLDDPPKVTSADVHAALNAMDIKEDGSCSLNYFIERYRAADFPFYADYAIYRASEPMAGPRQFIVTK